MARQAILGCEGDMTVAEVEPPTVITFHHDELVSFDTVRVNPRREFKVGLVGHVQGVVVFKHDMVALPVKAQGIIGTRTKFNHTVNREILRVVFEIVPRTRVNVSHVGAGDVNKVFVTAF